jgi:Icc-related predicted phosphoesterase
MPLFGKKTDNKATKLFFATDVHGSERTWRKFLNAGKFYSADVIVMGGDIIGKMAIPIIREGPGRYRATLQGRVEHQANEDELQALLERIGTLGFYSKVMDEDEYKTLQAEPQAVDSLFHALARERLLAWVELAQQRLAGTGIRCFITGGNDDYADVLAVLPQGGDAPVQACEGEVVQLDAHHTMASMGISTPTPWHTPREVTEDELGRLLEKLVASVPNAGKCIFNFHDPPIDSTLDTCPMLDWATDPPTPITQGGSIVLHGAGSASVRRAIETHQPMAGLHGHIHESRGVTKIGRSLCINPGSEYAEGILRGCLLSLEDGKVGGYQLTAG